MRQTFSLQIFQWDVIQPIEYQDVGCAYSKGGMFCVSKGYKVYMYPVASIRHIVKDFDDQPSCKQET